MRQIFQSLSVAFVVYDLKHDLLLRPLEIRKKIQFKIILSTLAFKNIHDFICDFPKGGNSFLKGGVKALQADIGENIASLFHDDKAMVPFDLMF